jgi:hypothetical protein
VFETLYDLNSFSASDVSDPKPSDTPAVYKPSLCYVCGLPQGMSSTDSVKLGGNAILVIHALCKKGLGIPTE